MLLGEKRHELAIADLRKAIELGAPTEGCSCDPTSPLAWAYLDLKRYDESWAVVRRAQAAKRWIMPETLERLKKESGRDG